MMIRRVLILSAIASSFFLLPLLTGCRSKQANYADKPYENKKDPIPFQKEGKLEFIKQGSEAVSIDVEIADTDSTRKRGLMERASLPEKSGMLFLFSSPEQSGFWMANTPLSLDIMFVGSDSSIVDIAKYTKPLSAKNVPSRKPYQYVVEVPAGFSDTHGLVVGQKVSWQQTS